MVERGTYSQYLKSGVDIFSLFEKGNEQSEPSPVPGTPTVISESLVQSLQSPRPSLKGAAPEDQEVSFSFCSVPGSVCSWWSHGPSVCSAHDIFICPKVHPNISKVLFHGIGRVRRAWGEQACLRFPFGCRMENLMEIRSGCSAMYFWVYVTHTDWELISFP